MGGYTTWRIECSTLLFLLGYEGHLCPVGGATSFVTVNYYECTGIIGGQAPASSGLKLE